jgi:nitrogen fixation-related uncharacterized protein
MRPAAILLILAVLIAALWAFDSYEYDGHYGAAAWGQVKQIEHDVENWFGEPQH